MNRWARRERCPRALALLIAGLAFFPLLGASAFIVGGVLELIFGSNLQNLAGSENTTLAFGIAICATCGYIGARCIYVLLAWRRVDDHDRYCWKCGYDLTANVSGICPECGVAVEERVQLRPCHQCGYSLLGNHSGVCPECGSTEPFAPPAGALCRLPLPLLKRVRFSMCLLTLAAAGFAALSILTIFSAFQSSRFGLWRVTPPTGGALTLLNGIASLVAEIGMVTAGSALRRCSRSRVWQIAAGVVSLGALSSLAVQVAFCSVAISGALWPQLWVTVPIVLPLFFLLRVALLHVLLGELMLRVPRRALRFVFWIPAFTTMTGFSCMLVAFLRTGWSFTLTRWGLVLALLPFAGALVSVVAMPAGLHAIFAVIARRKQYDATDDWGSLIVLEPPGVGSVNISREST